MSKTFSKDDVASHNKGDSLWIIVDDDVYDLTKFQDDHPGMLFASVSSSGGRAHFLITPGWRGVCMATVQMLSDTQL